VTLPLLLRCAAAAIVAASFAGSAPAATAPFPTKKATHVVLVGPAYVGVNQTYYLHGEVVGARSGTIVFQWRYAEFHKYYEPIGKTSFHNGVVRYRTSTVEPHVFVLQALYNGDATHLPSSATVTVISR
jgi:hypothetical protein